MYQQIRPAGFNILPPVVKNLMIVNGLMFLLTAIVQNRFRIDLADYLGLHWFRSELFQPFQLLTHIFMHADIPHLMSNMISLWIFGYMLEIVWGGKKFLIYYLLTAFGAAILHNIALSYDVYQQVKEMDPAYLQVVLKEGSELILQGRNYVDPTLYELNATVNWPTVGASGAVFGVLLAFGMTFPDSEMFPIPIKAKYLVAIYGAVELFRGFSHTPGDNVAHFAHLGGMLFGFILLKYWNRNKRYRI